MKQELTLPDCHQVQVPSIEAEQKFQNMGVCICYTCFLFTHDYIV